jgi:hypothetical protein
MPETVDATPARESICEALIIRLFFAKMKPAFFEQSFGECGKR